MNITQHDIDRYNDQINAYRQKIENEILLNQARVELYKAKAQQYGQMALCSEGKSLGCSGDFNMHVSGDFQNWVTQ